MIMPATTTVCVVDPDPGDYEALVRGPKEDRRVEFVRSGRDALRKNVTQKPDLWIINMRLPDMSGVDLHEILHARNPQVPCYLVGNDYRTEDEVSARRAGATMYFCKPLQREWVVTSPREDN